MIHFKVIVPRLNVRKAPVSDFADKSNIITTVGDGLELDLEEVPDVPNPSLGKWFRDSKNQFYSEKGLRVMGISDLGTKEIIYPWWIKNILFSIPDLWKDFTSQRVTIAILDTGINEHIDFDFNRIDGFNYLDNNADYKTDIHGHGTHLAGIISAQGEKSYGINPKANLFIGKVSDSSNTPSLEAVKKCLEDILNQRNGAENIDIINMSFQITVGTDPTEVQLKADIEDLLKRLFTKNNCLLVSAAGNINKIKNFFPASMEECISVGNINSELKRNPNSTMATSLDIMAPGTEITSLKGIDEVSIFSGTSQSCAFISAICSYGIQELKSKKLNVNKIITKHLLHTAFNGSFPIIEYGSGIVNANQFIKSIKTILT